MILGLPDASIIDGDIPWLSVPSAAPIWTALVSGLSLKNQDSSTLKDLFPLFSTRDDVLRPVIFGKWTKLQF